MLVAERTPDFATVGAGIGLAAGPEVILDALGIERAGVGEPIRRLEVRDAGGRVVRSVQLLSRRIGHAAQLRSSLDGRVRNTVAAATPGPVLRRQHAALNRPGHRLAAALRAML